MQSQLNSLSSSAKSPHTESYTDLNALTKLKTQARDNQDEALPEVAKQFESVLIAMLIKTMRQSTMSEDSLFSSSAGDNYQSMHDQQLSLELAKGKGIGLADSIIRQLKKDKQVITSPLTNDQFAIEKLNSEKDVKNLKLPQRRSFDYAIQKMKSVIASIDDGTEKTTNILEKASEFISTSNSSSEKNKSEHNDLELDLTTPERFVQSLWPMAEKSAKELGLKPEVLLAQAALETGWGQSIIQNSASSSFNLFNIKADSRWEGNKMQTSSLEYEQGTAVNRKSSFRAYDNVQQSFDDYVNFIQNNPRYQSALEVTSNPVQYLHEIHQAGYATDPNYADKIIRVMNSDSMQKPILKKST